MDGSIGEADGRWLKGTTYFAYQPGHNQAVVRCNGREVARVPIRPPRPR